MSPNQNQSNRADTHLTDAELNELVDGSLAGRELDRARTHLSTCQDCEERYRTLMATVAALKQAPSLMPRRSFQLSREQAKLPEKQTSWLDRFAERILPGVPAIKAATIAVALLLVSITAFDVLTNQSAQDNSSPSTAMQQEADIPAPTQMARAMVTEPAPAAAFEQAPVSDSEADAPSQENEFAGGAAAPDTTDDSAVSSSAMEQAPAAPAPAMEMASPAPQSTAIPVTVATQTVSGTPAATATPVPSDTVWSFERTISVWRLVELGLLMVLVWLVVSWVGRSLVGKLDE